MAKPLFSLPIKGLYPLRAFSCWLLQPQLVETHSQCQAGMRQRCPCVLSSGYNPKRPVSSSKIQSYNSSCMTEHLNGSKPNSYYLCMYVYTCACPLGNTHTFRYMCVRVCVHTHMHECGGKKLIHLLFLWHCPL